MAQAQEEAGGHNFFEMMGVMLAYPSDDITFIWVGDDRLHVTEAHSTRQQLVFILGILLVAHRGIRVLLFGVIGDWVLWLRHNTAYQHYRDGRGDPPAWLHWPVLSVVVAIGWLVAWARLDWPLLPVAPSPEWMRLGSAIATILGGKLISAIGRVIALLMLRCGIDVEKVWYDEILGILLGGTVLAVFGNDRANIAVYVLAEVLPAVAGHFYGRWKRRHEPVELALAPKKGKLLARAVASPPQVACPVDDSAEDRSEEPPPVVPPVARPVDDPPPVAKPVVRPARRVRWARPADDL